MNRMIAWFAENSVAANLMMLLIIIAGLLAVPQTRKELIPNISLDRVSISIVYPGASPTEVEKSVCVPVEENIFDIDGIHSLQTSARQDTCVVVAEVDGNFDSREVMDEIRARVDAITVFPDDAEDPVIQEIRIKSSVASVIVSGDVDEHSLTKLAEEVRDDLTDLPSITQVSIENARPYEINVEISDRKLKEYQLSFDQLATAMRNQSLDLPGGVIKTPSGDVQLRTLAQAYHGDDFRRLVIRTVPNGGLLHLGDIAKVDDGFAESDVYGELNGKQGILMTVFRVGDQNILSIADEIKQYLKEKQARLPQGVHLNIWQDKSAYFKGRMWLLTRNAISGLILVFLILVLFLRLRLAFWVSLGIPVSFLGALWMLPQVDGSINMISMFGFILVLGIVVDDAIVVGENIHTFHHKGMPGLRGAIAGAQDVARPVIFAVLTSVVTFMPILFLPGAEGRLWKVIPEVVIMTLLFSLFECLFILPAHLAGIGESVVRKNPLSRMQQSFTRWLDGFIQNRYRVLLEKALEWRYLTLTFFISVFLVFIMIVAAGWLHLVFFPKVEGDIAIASVRFPQGTPAAVTQKAIDQLEHSAEKLKQALHTDAGDEILNVVSTLGVQAMSRSGEAGSNVAEVSLEMAPSENRKDSSGEILNRWRELTGDIPGATRVSFQASLRNSGPDINLQLYGHNLDRLGKAADALKQELDGYPGLYDIQDTFENGKKEIRIHLKPEAHLLGVDSRQLARQVRQGFYGEEVQRLQRGRDEVKVFLRFPEKQRHSLYTLENMHIRLGDGTEIPIKQVADLSITTGPAEIRRVDRKRIIGVTAEVDETRAVAGQVMKDLKARFLDKVSSRYPGVHWEKAGSQKDQDDLIRAMEIGFILSLFGIYMLMAIPFKSYAQPLMVMSAIPFGLIGAILGHAMLGLDISLLSLSGMIAVAGVVVNDNLVLVDYINRKVRDGVPMARAIRDAGVARFRPIILTSLTTFAGLTPLMLERSVQAQFLIPMAVSLAFGVMFATLVTLILVPASYHILGDIQAFRQSRPKAR